MEELLNRVYVSPSYNRNNNPWVVSVFDGMLGKIDADLKKEKLTKYVGILENGNGKYTDVIECNGKLYLLPDLAEENPHLLVVAEGKEKKISLRKFDIPEEKRGLSCFLSGRCIGKFIFAFGSSYPAIVRIDTDSDSVEYIVGWTDEIKRFGASASSIGYLDSVQQVLLGNELYVPFSCVRALVKIDIDTLKEEVIEVNVQSEGFSCIAEVDKSHFLLTGAGDNSDWLYIWNKEKQTVEKTVRLQGTPDELPVKYMLRSNSGEYYLFPWKNWSYQENLDIYRFNYQTGELHNTHLIENHRNKDGKAYLFGHEVVYACWKDENTLMYVTGKDLLWHEYNVDTKDYLEYEMSVDLSEDNVEGFVTAYYKDYAKNKKPIVESKMGLQGFMKVFDLLSKKII